MRDSSEIPTANMGLTIVGKYLKQRPTTGNSDMAAKTRITYISRTVTGSVKLQPQIRHFWPCRTRCKCSHDCDTTDIGKWQDWRPILLLPVVDRARRGRKPQISFWNFDRMPWFQRYKHFRFWRPHCHFRLSFLSQSFGGRHVYWAHWCGKCRIFWNFNAICHDSKDISISGFGGHMLFPVVGRCCSHSPALSSNTLWS